jgi:hypothetical protein
MAQPIVESISNQRGVLLDEDGFTIVTRKSMNKRKVASRSTRTKNTMNVSTDDREETIATSFTTIDSFRAKHLKLKKILKITPMYQFLLKNLPNVQTIVCYGLGSLTIKRSRMQLALVCLVAEHLSTIKVWSYDPCHTIQDKLLLEDCGINIISENEQGKRMISEGENRILFFMPHCDRWLYNNVIDYQIQQENLADISILGNSFIEYTRRFPEENDSIYKSLAILNERKVPIQPGEDSVDIDTHAMFEAFNDLRLMTFSSTIGHT